MQIGTIVIVDSDITKQLNFALSQQDIFIFLLYLLKSPPILRKDTWNRDFYLLLLYCKNILSKRDLGQRPGRCNILFRKAHNITKA